MVTNDRRRMVLIRDGAGVAARSERRGRVAESGPLFLNVSDCRPGRAANLSAAAYVTKRAAHDEIAEVIRLVHAGQRATRIGFQRAPRHPQPGLFSARELKVLRLMRLRIAERTVKSHASSVLAKLNAADQAGAVARGFDLGLLSIDPTAAR